jgi:hypothetical protein
MTPAECEEWREMASEAITVAEYWKERACAAKRRARIWKAAAKRQRAGWRGAFTALERSQARFHTYRKREAKQ